MAFPLPLWPIVFVLPLALCFYYFLLAGSRTFEIGPDDDLSAGIAQVSFFGTGMLATLGLGYRATISPANAVGGALGMACSLALYEWARRTIRERRFHIGWSGEVPDALCQAGPYAYVRHPVYLSYMLAFAAMLIALPSLWTLAILLFNVALFAHAARHDERSIAASDLAAAYEGYKRRTGMFFPRLTRPGSRRSGAADGE